MRTSYKFFCIVALLIFAGLLSPLLRAVVVAQQTDHAPSSTERGAASPSPSPTPSAPAKQNVDETVKITTEEVRIPVFAFDDYGNTDYALVPDDVLILEDGVPQVVRSVRRIPANVLVLLDVGGEGVSTNGLSKSTFLTRQTAARVIANLKAGDQIALMQFSDRPELLQNWTTDKQQLTRTLVSKLYSGKRARPAEAFIAAAATLRGKPEGSRHVVLITDGVETPGGRTSLAEGVKQLTAARAAVHIISYTQLVRQKPSDKDKRAAPSNASINDRNSIGIIRNAGVGPAGSPPGAGPTGIPNSSGGGIFSITFDPAMRRARKAYEADVARGEKMLTTLADETGGRVWLPKSDAEMVAQSAEVARDIGAQFVVTYTPKRPLAAARGDEYRRIQIAARRTGLHLRSRRGYVATPNTTTNTTTTAPVASP